MLSIVITKIYFYERLVTFTAFDNKDEASVNVCLMFSIFCKLFNPMIVTKMQFTYKTKYWQCMWSCDLYVTRFGVSKATVKQYNFYVDSEMQISPTEQAHKTLSVTITNFQIHPLDTSWQCHGLCLPCCVSTEPRALYTTGLSPPSEAAKCQLEDGPGRIDQPSDKDGHVCVNHAFN